MKTTTKKKRGKAKKRDRIGRTTRVKKRVEVKTKGTAKKEQKDVTESVKQEKENHFALLHQMISYNI